MENKNDLTDHNDVCLTNTSNLKEKDLSPVNGAENFITEEDSTTKPNLENEPINGSSINQINLVIEEFLNLGEIQNALVLIKEAIAKGIANAVTVNNLGYACWQTGAKDQALICFHKALVLEPAQNTFLCNFIEASYSLKNYDLLSNLLRKLIKEQPDNEDCLFLLADCRKKEGKMDESENLMTPLI